MKAVRVFESSGFYGFDSSADGVNLPRDKGPWMASKTMLVSRGGSHSAGRSQQIMESLDRDGYHLLVKAGNTMKDDGHLMET